MFVCKCLLFITLRFLTRKDLFCSDNIRTRLLFGCWNDHSERILELSSNSLFCKALQLKVIYPLLQFCTYSRSTIFWWHLHDKRTLIECCTHIWVERYLALFSTGRLFKKKVIFSPKTFLYKSLTVIFGICSPEGTILHTHSTITELLITELTKRKGNAGTWATLKAWIYPLYQSASEQE